MNLILTQRASSQSVQAIYVHFLDVVISLLVLAKKVIQVQVRLEWHVIFLQLLQEKIVRDLILTCQVSKDLIPIMEFGCVINMVN